MALHFYNPLSRSLEPFEPIEPGTVRVYACGPTVYEAPHIGNYRAFIFNDLLHRYLRWKGYRVKFIMNLTDVDDKTILGALEREISLDDFTEPVIREFFGDLDRLGVEPATVYPRATEYIGQMVELIGKLMERGHAYAVDGSVYFDISSFEPYGKLAGIDPAEMRQGERVSADEYGKGDVRDFALWKAAKEEDREVGAVWDTPWGAGRPGWHIECSAMSMAELGETFDIHTGGEDLIFPHHEDEIAQSEAATGKPFVHYWLHVKHLLVHGEKMSKSKGNVFSLEELRERGFSLAAIRYLLLSAHYRHELNFTFTGLEDAQAALRRAVDFYDRLERTRTSDDAHATRLSELAENAIRSFQTALDDDLNLPAGLAALFTFIREANAALDKESEVPTQDLQDARGALRSIDQVLNVIELARREREPIEQELAEWVEDRLAERQDARARRDFDRADLIRDELASAGVIIEDTPEGPRWKRKA
jgi:cysteinyl-tRNA synthetase